MAALWYFRRHAGGLRMCSDIAIHVSHLSKCYQMYDKPQDRLKQMFARGRRKYYVESWALKDVSFEIKRGETVGIIGRNGSGKSTTLQIVCGTLNPTEGKVETSGRIAALLELGSGFNPEFTGRENVYLSASIYGLSREQVNERYERIARFADIGDYIDQPVRTYSSGMYVRLAFAVIAHVDADILIVDEALAVGDAVFTQKCMRFIRDFKERGTLLFVSHDMGSVVNLCERAIWLHQGQVREVGTAKGISQRYLQYSLQEVYGTQANLESVGAAKDEQTPAAEPLPETVVHYDSKITVEHNLSAANGWKSGGGEVVAVELLTGQGLSQGVLEGGEEVTLIIRAKLNESMLSPIIGFVVRDRLGQDLFGENTLPFSAAHQVSAEAGDMIEGRFVFELPMLPNGQYSVVTSLANGTLQNHVQHHWLHDALILHVASTNIRWGLVGVRIRQLELKKLDKINQGLDLV